MFDTPRLSVAYIRKYPASAGRLLASMLPEDVAGFLQTVPTQYSAQVLANMNPGPASLIIRQMGTTAGTAVLRDLGFAEVSTILRQIDPAERKQFLAELPDRLRRDFETSLDFPADTVGANMTTAIATAAQTDKSSSALDLVRQANGNHADVIFVVDDQRKLIGVVTVTSLLGRPAGSELSELLDRSCVALSAQARLGTIAELDAWHDYNRLPVVRRNGELIGAISRQALRRSAMDSEEDKDANVPSLAESITAALTASVVGLSDLLITSPGSAERRGDNHDR